MSEIQYGVRGAGVDDSRIIWTSSREEADYQVWSGTGRTLMAREVGEPHEVKELPTTPGSVIKTPISDKTLILLADAWYYAHNKAYMPKKYIGDDFTVLYDAGASDA